MIDRTRRRFSIFPRHGGRFLQRATRSGVLKLREIWQRQRANFPHISLVESGKKGKWSSKSQWKSHGDAESSLIFQVPFAADLVQFLAQEISKIVFTQVWVCRFSLHFLSKLDKGRISPKCSPIDRSNGLASFTALGVGTMRVWCQTARSGNKS